jgi:dihydrofolate reductase
VGKLIMWNVITLDGYFEGASSWDLPWLEQAWGEELEQFSIEQLRSADALVFGRVTYEGMASHWRSAKGEIAEDMNGLPKVVCSHTLRSAEWNNSTLVKHDATSAIEKLKQGCERSLFVFGSANLSESMIKANLFDEYRLGIAPVIHGRGRLLFSQPLRHLRLELLDARPLSNGCVILRYRPAAAA